MTARLLISTLLGSLLEWYDFSVFAYMAPVISKLFFPHEDEFAALLAAYSIFAVGFLIRPFGAAFFGHFGDRLGRKRILVLSLFWIAIATLGMGLLPTYAQIGIAAPLLLILLRLIQGFCVGGETTGAASFILESYKHKYPGAVGSISWMAVGLGMLLGSLISTLIINLFSEAELYQWAWRLPFLLGIFAAVVGYYIRRGLPESVLFKEAKTRGELAHSPLRATLKDNKKDVARVSGLYCLSAMITYLIFVFMPSYAAEHAGVTFKEASKVTTLAIACVTFGVPLSGLLSDFIGRIRCLLIGATGFIVLSYPLYLQMTRAHSYFGFVIVESIFVLLAILYQGVLTTAAQEIPKTYVRYSVTALGYNLSNSIVGGSAPLLAAYLVHVSGNSAAPGILLTFGGLLAMCAIVSVMFIRPKFGYHRGFSCEG